MDRYATDTEYVEIRDIGHPGQNIRSGYTLASAYNFKGLSANSTILLGLLAFMNPDRVQEYIFVDRKVSSGKGKSFWTGPVFDSALYELLSSSVIKRITHKKELWIHRLIQAEVRARMDEDERYQTFKDAVSLLAKTWPPGDHSSQKVKRWAVCEELLPHLERFYQLYIEHSEAWDAFSVDPTFPFLLKEAAA